jgi:hypothetical protein
VVDLWLDEDIDALFGKIVRIYLFEFMHSLRWLLPLSFLRLADVSLSRLGLWPFLCFVFGCHSLFLDGDLDLFWKVLILKLGIHLIGWRVEFQGGLHTVLVLTLCLLRLHLSYVPWWGLLGHFWSSPRLAFTLTLRPILNWLHSLEPRFDFLEFRHVFLVASIIIRRLLFHIKNLRLNSRLIIVSPRLLLGGLRCRIVLFLSLWRFTFLVASDAGPPLRLLTIFVILVPLNIGIIPLLVLDGWLVIFWHCLHLSFKVLVTSLITLWSDILSIGPLFVELFVFLDKFLGSLNNLLILLILLHWGLSDTHVVGGVQISVSI